MRWLIPGFMKRWIFGSGLIDKMHSSNRKAQASEKLSSEEREIAMNYFREDLKTMEELYGIKDVV